MKLAARIPIVLAVLAVAAVSVAPVLAAEHDVEIDKLAFLPAEITVAVGDTVVWTVTNAVPEGHSVTSGAPDAADAGDVFDSKPGLTANGQTFEHTFTEPGEFPYYCQIHGAAMSGTVVVLAEGASAPPSSGEPGPAEEHPPVSVSDRVTAGAILAVAIVLMFGLAWLWRRMNPA